MRRQMRDPEVRRKAWPDYTFGCKRILFSSHYLPALGRENVSLVTDAVSEIVPEGVRTADGHVHPADVLIWGTGFKTTEFMFPMDIVGRGGRTLAQEWADGAHAHLGMTVPGFPSLFVLYGPNTNTSGGSIIVFLEAQVAYVRQALQETARRRADALEVRRDVETRHRREAAGGVRGHGLDAVRLLVPRRVRPHRGQLAALHAASTCGPCGSSTRRSSTSPPWRGSCPQAPSTLGTERQPV